MTLIVLHILFFVVFLFLNLGNMWFGLLLLAAISTYRILQVHLEARYHNNHLGVFKVQTCPVLAISQSLMPATSSPLPPLAITETLIGSHKIYLVELWFLQVPQTKLLLSKSFNKMCRVCWHWVCNIWSLSKCLCVCKCVGVGGGGMGGGGKKDQHYNEWVLFFDFANMQYLCRCHGESTALLLFLTKD